MLGIMAGQAVGAAAGLGINALQNKQQLNQAEKMQELQMEGMKEMGEFNKGLALEMWNDTNYGAQRKHMEKAGLNVGLMYEQGGGGGVTSSFSPGQVSGQNAQTGDAGMAMMRGMDAALMAAQVKNVEANTEKTKVEANKLAGVDTQEAWSRTNLNIQKTENEAVNEEILGFEKEIRNVEANIATTTEEDLVRTIRAGRRKLEGEAERAVVQGHISQATERELIKQAQIETQRAEVNVLLQKGLVRQTGAQTELTKEQTAMTRELTNKYIAEVTRMENETKRDFQQLDQQMYDMITRRTLQEFQTSTPAQIKQWTDVVNGVTKSLRDIGGFVDDLRPKAFKSEHKHYGDRYYQSGN